MNNILRESEIFHDDEWSRTMNDSGLTLGYTHFACQHDLLLVGNHKRSGNSLHNFAVCSNLESWETLPNPFGLSDCISLGFDENRMHLASITNDNGYYEFNIVSSYNARHWNYNGLLWDNPKKYAINRDNVNLSYSRTRYLSGTHYFLYTGFYFISLRSGQWMYVSLPEEHKNSVILDLAYFHNVFYFLLNNGKEIHIVTSTDGTTFSNRAFLVWPGVTPKSINCNNNQLVIVGYEDNGKKCVILYADSENAKNNEWKKISFTPLGLEENHVCSLYDLLFYRENWYIVGSTTRFKYNRPFSVAGLTYKIEGDISITNPLLMESNPSTNLKRIYVDQNNGIIYSIGNATPTGNYFVLCKRIGTGT